jgi:hypothetical protein
MVKTYIVSAPGIRPEEAVGKKRTLELVSKFLDISPKVLVEME